MSDSKQSFEEREAFMRLCEALGIPASAGAYLDGARLAVAMADAKQKLARVAATAQSMADRAADNPKGINSETLAMFADELRLALEDVPAKKSDWHWVCNQCGSAEFTSCVSEADVNQLGCSGCGGDEWHREPV